MQNVDKDALAFLLSPEGTKSFWKDTWEKKHKVFKATAERKKVFEGVLAFSDLCALLEKQEESGKCLEFSKDVHAMRYVDGEREDVERDPFSPLESGEAAEIFEAGATFQVHQPQRFNEKLWRICAALESQLGSLVGCNAYITPPGAQGLAPHYDDVELWVCQTSGKKKWSVYGPLPGQELPPASSSDIPRGALPPPALEVTLEPGDVLYLPRGHVHEAQARGGAPSAHVTISTYQQWSWKDLLDRVIGNLAMAADGGPQLPLSLRAGIPSGFVYRHAISPEVAPKLTEAALSHLLSAGPGPGSALGGSAAATDAASALAQGLRDAAAAVEAAPEVAAVEAQAMGAEFMRARLPPHPASLPDSGPQPSLQSRICCRKADAFMLVLDEAVEGRGDESDAESDDMLEGDSSDGESGGSEDSDGSEASEPQDEEGAGAAAAGKVKPASKGNGAPAETTKADKAAASCGGAAGAAAAAAPDDDASGSGDEDSEGLPSVELPFCMLLSCLHNERATHMVSGGGAGPGDSPDPLMLMGPGSGDDEDGEEPPALVPLEANPKAAKNGKSDAAKAAAGDDADGADTDEDTGMPQFLHIPLHQAGAVAAIMECVKGKSMAVADLPLEEDEEKVVLAMALHSWGMLSTVPAAAKKRPLEQGAKGAGPSKKKKTKQKKK